MRLLKKFLISSALVALMASTSMVATTTAAESAVPMRQRQFTATGRIAEYYTTQTVTGTYRNGAGKPVNVTVYNYAGTALVFKAHPKLDTAWWGNYWHDAYGLDQWYVGKADGTVYHLMLPPKPMGSMFSALLVSEFSMGGNWQNWLDGTST